LIYANYKPVFEQNSTYSRIIESGCVVEKYKNVEKKLEKNDSGESQENIP